jgi:hypothetical protein
MSTAAVGQRKYLGLLLPFARLDAPWAFLGVSYGYPLIF